MTEYRDPATIESLPHTPLPPIACTDEICLLWLDVLRRRLIDEGMDEAMPMIQQFCRDKMVRAGRLMDRFSDGMIAARANKSPYYSVEGEDITIARSIKNDDDKHIMESTPFNIAFQWYWMLHKAIEEVKPLIRH